MKNKIFLITISLFIALIAVLNIATPQISFSENENRALAKFPSFSFDSLLNGEMSEEFESYIADQFIFRDKWVSANAVMEKLIGKKENNGVYFADDDYLIEVPKYNMDIVKSNIEAIKDFDEIDFKLLLIPTAYEVLRDKLPKYAYTDIQKKIINLAQDSVNVVTPLNELSDNKDKYIYYRTDHHQTNLGSYITYKKLCENLELIPVQNNEVVLSDEFYGSTWSKATLPDITPDTISTVKSDIKCTMTVNDKLVYDSIFDCEKLKTKDKYTVFLGGNYGKTTIETNADSDKTVLIIKDSYANGLIPYLVNHYSKIIMIDLRYYNQSVKELIKSEGIDNLIYIYNVSTFATDDNLKKIKMP